MKKRNLLWLVLAVMLMTCSAALAWDEDGSILEYDPEQDTVDAIPLNAGGAAGDSFSDRFSAYSREGGTGVSDIRVCEDEDGSKVIRFYSTDAYSSGNLNVYMTKKADISSGPVIISTRIKGYNSQNSSAAYFGQRMFPQISLRSASATTRQPIFTMYNGSVAAGDVGGAAIKGVSYENEWHDVLLRLVPEDGNAVSIDYYFDGNSVNNSRFALNSQIDLSELLITFGAHFRSGNAQCFYDDIHIYRCTEQEFTLKKTENVALSENLVLNFKNQLDPQSLVPENVQITADGEPVAVRQVTANESMNGIEVAIDGAYNEETTYSVSVNGILDLFGQECTRTAEFTTGKATLLVEDARLALEGEPMERLVSGPLTVKTIAHNQTKQEQDVTVAAVLYKGSKAVKLFVTPYKTIAAGEDAEIALDMQIDDLSDGDYTLHVFCMNDILRLGSLKKATVFTE